MMTHPFYQCINKHFLSRSGNILKIVWNNYSRIGCYGTTNITDNIKLHPSYLEICKESWPQSVILKHVWLRDHCRCDDCYNHVTSQRKFDILKLPLDIQPKKIELKEDNLIIFWPDGHSSKYSLEWLWSNSHDGLLFTKYHSPILWNKNQTNNIARVDISSYMNSEKGVYDILKSIADYGVGIVSNVPATLKATEEVVLNIAHPLHTMFSNGMWEVANEFVLADTAYGSDALDAHNDNTYFTEATGLQVFHCIHHDGEGGETLLVDGFRAARDLQQSHPLSYKRLCMTPFEAEYLDSGKNYFNVDYILKLHPLSKQLQQIRFNMYDRAPMKAVPSEQILQLYQDLQFLAKKIKDINGEWLFKLQPGMVLFIDNWRVLHGRASYTGLRKLVGCYIGWADYMSKARLLGVI